MPSPALVTMQAVQDWLNAGGTTSFPQSSNQVLSRLIASASAFVPSFLSAAIAPATYSELYNGDDQPALTLRHSPIVRVRSLVIGTTAVVARPAPDQYGFIADTDTLYIDGGGSYGFGGPPRFCKGVQNVAVTYDAGYQTSDTVTVPASGPFDSTSLSQVWNADRGVAYATGAAFTLVTTTPTLAATYQVTFDQFGTPQYVFAAADAGAAIVITYGYTPADVAQACVELVGEAYKRRNRIGETAHSFPGGMTTAFSQRDMSPAIRSMLLPFRRVGLVAA